MIGIVGYDRRAFTPKLKVDVPKSPTCSSFRLLSFLYEGEEGQCGSMRATTAGK
jgi:hypothetical protein